MTGSQTDRKKKEMRRVETGKTNRQTAAFTKVKAKEKPKLFRKKSKFQNHEKSH